MYYTFREHYPNCYSLHRPDGTNFYFLQGDDAREFEETLEGIYTKQYPFGIFKCYEHLLSIIIDQYDI